MTILKDISDTLKDAINIAKDMDISLNKQTSIAKMSSDATLQFPVIISRAINVDTSQTVTKALERQYAIFIQMIISMNPYLDLDKDRNLQGYIKKNLHQNTVNLIDLNESAMDLYSDIFGNTMLFSLNEGCSGQTLASNREQMFNPDLYLNNKILNNLYASKNISLESAMLNLDYYYKSNPELLTESSKSKKKSKQRRQERKVKDMNNGRYDSGTDDIDDLFDHDPYSDPTKDSSVYHQNNNYNDDKELNVAKDLVRELKRKNDHDADMDILNQERGYRNDKLEKDKFNHSKRMDERRTQAYEKYVEDQRKALEKAQQTADKREEAKRKAEEKAQKLDEKKFKHQKYLDRQNLRAAEAERKIREEDKKIEREKDKLNRARQEKMDNHRIEMDKASREADEKKFKHELNKTKWDYQSKTMVKLSDNDVKKCNELVPTTLSVTLQIKDGNSFGGVSNFVIGVKGLMHPVNSDDMISNLLSGFKSGNKFFNILRWTSGEIKFMKDLILNVDNIREDVVRKHKKNGSSWWSALKRRRNVAALRRIKGSGRILPNATIVCSMTEVDELKEAYGIDLLDGKVINKIMKTYFLLGFAVVDDSQELCHFIFDGENKYQVVSFAGLEKENNNKNDFKDIYKLINSGRL